MKDNNKTNHANVILNLFQDLNKGIRKKEQGNKFVTEDIKRHPEGTRAEDVRREPYPFNASVKCPKDLQTQSHVITSHNVEQEVQKSVRSDVVIPNKLDNGETCKGLLRRFVHKIANSNEISPHNDMNNKILKQVQHDNAVVVQNIAKDKNSNELINLSTYRLIDFKKVAFTLAEVLITLGIIGIVAAITIPGLINNYKANKLRTQYLKSYSTLAQMVKLIEQDDIELNNTDTIMNLTKYLPGSTKKEGSDLQDKNNTHNDPFYYYLSDKYKTYDGKGNANKTMFDDVQYALPDGSLLLMEWDDTHFPNGDHHWISVDINGYNNGPNRWGVDLFTFQVLDGKMLAIGDKGSIYTDMSQYCNSQKATNYYNGIACAHLAKTDTEYFKKAVRLK